MTERRDTLQLGDLVWWRGAWGSNEPRIAQVDGIERYTPNGIRTTPPVVPWRDVMDGDVVVTLTNGHWAWAYQISLCLLWRHLRVPASDASHGNETQGGRPGPERTTDAHGRQ
jgi:hypothetical protein